MAICSLLALFPLLSSAQTALELLDAGSFAFSNQDYPKAEENLARFVKDYGSSAEAARSMEPALRLLGVAQIKQEKFTPAIDTLNRYLKEYPQGEKVEEFSFWLGIAFLKTQEFKKAIDALDLFIKTYPRSPKLPDALFSRGLALLQEDKFKETADYFLPILNQLPPEMAFQGRIIRLYCLIETDQLENAFNALGEIDPLSDSATKIAAYHLLALDLGNRFLARENYRQALSVLQRVCSRNRILSRQQARLTQLQKSIAQQGSSRSPESSYELLRQKDTVAQVEREIERLNKMADYDTALQFRIGQCYLQLERPREAYLVMKEMVARLPDSELLASANYTLLICLTRMERWDEVITAAQDFEKRFPKNKELPNVLYIKAEAHQRIYDYANAHLGFLAVAQRFPDFAQTPRCRFLAGYALLMLDRNAEAYTHFEELLKSSPQTPFAEQSLYWQCMSLHFAKDYERSREAFAHYLKKYPKGSKEADAVYRRAQSLFNQKLFTQAYKELEDFLKKYPGSTPFDEACNLLGDAYLALGEVDRGIAAYRRVSGQDPKLYDYGIFRIGLAYKAMEQFDDMRKHFESFLKARPKSPRLTEALAQLAWIHRRNDQPDLARKVYWDAIREHGNDPEASAVEDMLHTLARMARQPEEKTQFEAQLSALTEESITAKNLPWPPEASGCVPL
ncbi:MAG: tetratricopeptide repeat protein [Blastochloris sp.]|nr:tetratricopeptide repeat protein [Blastochloris sp.]